MFSAYHFERHIWSPVNMSRESDHFQVCLGSGPGVSGPEFALRLANDRSPRMSHSLDSVSICQPDSISVQLVTIVSACNTNLHQVSTGFCSSVRLLMFSYA